MDPCQKFGQKMTNFEICFDVHMDTSVIVNMTEDFSLKALVLGAIRLSASAESQKLLRL